MAKTDPVARAHILTRQSITGEKDVSLDVQEERCRAYCHERGYTVVSVSREESVRGWQDDREGIANAMERAANHGYDVLIAWDTSRVARSVRILEQLLHDLDQHGARFESVSEPWVSTPFVRQVLAAVAEEQTRTISRNVSAAKAAVARRGQWHGGPPPLGYRLVKVADAPSVLVPDEREGPLVTEVFRRMALGESAGSIARDFYARGIVGRRANAWSISVISGMVHNPIYTGVVRYRGEIVATDAHPPLTSQEQWEQANQFLARRAVVRYNEQRPTHWLEGRLYHACGLRMYLQVHRHKQTSSGWQSMYICASHSGQGRQHFGRCDTARPRVSAHQAGWTARRCLVADLNQMLDLVDAMAAAEQTAGGDAVAEERSRLIERREAATRRYERVRDAWADGNEPVEWLEDQRARRDAVYAETDALLAQLPAAPDPVQFRRAADTLLEFRALIDTLVSDELTPIIATLGTVTFDSPNIVINYYPEYQPFIPSPHVESVPVGLPRAVTATNP